VPGCNLLELAGGPALKKPEQAEQASFVGFVPDQAQTALPVHFRRLQPPIFTIKNVTI
jgi:hypothetical protein